MICIIGKIGIICIVIVNVVLAFCGQKRRNHGVAPLLLLPRSPGDEEHWQTMADLTSQ